MYWPSSILLPSPGTWSSTPTHPAQQLERAIARCVYLELYRQIWCGEWVEPNRGHQLIASGAESKAGCLPPATPLGCSAIDSSTDALAESMGQNHQHIWEPPFKCSTWTVGIVFGRACYCRKGRGEIYRFTRESK